MCGLVGIAGDTSSNWKDVFTDLLVVDSLRGAHSTGMATVKRHQSEIGLLKQPGGPHSLLGAPEYRTHLHHSLKALIGHNRYATVGEHTIENAHPFAFPSIVGAHNGTLDKSSIKLLHDNEKFGTDSEAIYANMDQFGLRDTVDKLRGAWALTWFDKDKNTINLLRNEKRPLFYCYSKDRCTLLWASEGNMLEFVLNRARNAMHEDTIYAVDPDTHYEWVIPDSISSKFAAPQKWEMKAPPPPPVTYEYWNGGGYRTLHGQGGSGGNVLPFRSSQTGGTKSTVPIIDLRKKDTSKFRPPYKLPGGKILNKKDFYRVVSEGCAFCGQNNIEWGEFIHPMKACGDHDIFLCEECYNDDDVFETCSNLL